MLLSNGKASVSRVEVVIFDAMYTVIESKLPRFYLIKKVFEDVLGIQITPAQLAQYLRESKTVIPAEVDYIREWAIRNCYIVARLLGKNPAEVTDEVGRQIHTRIVSDASLYEVKPAMRNLLILLTCLKDPPKLVVASNQYEEHLNILIDEFDLRGFFRSRVFTSDILSVSKPNPRFYGMILEKLPAALNQVVIIGNSVTRDLPPARDLGIPICLYDRGRKLDMVSTHEVGIVRNHEEMERWLLSWLLPRPPTLPKPCRHSKEELEQMLDDIKEEGTV